MDSNWKKLLIDVVLKLKHKYTDEDLVALKRLADVDSEAAEASVIKHMDNDELRSYQKMKIVVLESMAFGNAHIVNAQKEYVNGLLLSLALAAL